MLVFDSSRANVAGVVAAALLSVIVNLTYGPELAREASTVIEGLSTADSGLVAELRTAPNAEPHRTEGPAPLQYQT